MMAFIASSAVLFPLAFMSHPGYGTSARHLVVPGIQGEATSDAILLIIAIVSTTVALWQLFFQQSNVIDKRITPRFIGYERADTFLGSVVVVVGAGALMIAGAYAVLGTNLAGHFTDALGVAHALEAKDNVLGVLFTIVLIPGAPLGVVTEAVQALADLLLPSASVFLLLLCNDREVLGPWVNHSWLNAVATVIIAALLMLSGTLMAATMFPHFNVPQLVIWLSAGIAACLAAFAITLRVTRRHRGTQAKPPPLSREERLHWRMPPLAMLKPVTWSPGLSSPCSRCAATSSSPPCCCSSRPSNSAPGNPEPTRTSAFRSDPVPWAVKIRLAGRRYPAGA
jgi:hypothetical protein